MPKAFLDETGVFGDSLLSVGDTYFTRSLSAEVATSRRCICSKKERGT